MKTTTGWKLLRVGAILTIGFLVAPISGASTLIASRDAVIGQRNGPASIPLRGDADAEKLPQMAFLDRTAPPETERGLIARFGASVVAEEARLQTSDTMGLQLPEPGPLSAIIATLALAVFVLIRRIA